MPTIRVVPDTNILISSVFWRGKPFQVIKFGLERKYDLITSTEILEEFVDKMLNKFGFPEDRLAEQMDIIFAHFQIVPKISTVNVVRDPKDNKVVETAIDGRANYIVSGDPDLTDLKEFRGIKILTPDEFLKSRI